MPAPLPFMLEDRTGQITDTDFDDMYHRIFLRVGHLKQYKDGSATMIYSMDQRSSRHRDTLPFCRSPSVIIQFGSDNSLGNITFTQPVVTTPVPMTRYLRKLSIFGPSLSRKFIASDGREYRWSYRTVPGQEWSCITPENFLAAHYDLKPPEVRAYGVSGHVLTVYEVFAHLTIEILASLTVMRHIAQYNL